MIDYITWSQEYENQCKKLEQRIKELRDIRSSGCLTLTPEEILSINERITKLRSILYEQRITAKVLKERCERIANKKQRLRIPDSQR